jgi:hypothetical protein
MISKDIDYSNIEYAVKPEKIRIEHRERACCCDNCANVGEVFIIKYNETNYRMPNGSIGKKRYAKPRELWLCKKCYNELLAAIEIRGIRR